MILLIGYLNSPECELVSIALQKQAAKFLRLDVDLVGLENFITARNGAASWSFVLRTKDQIFKDREISAIYLANFRDPHKTVASSEEEFARNENERFINWWLDCVCVPVLCRPRFTSLAANKIRQLEMAARVGFTVPPTCLTNSPDDIRHFVRENTPCVYKPVDHASLPAVVNGEIKAIYAQRVDEKALGNDEELAYCASTFQAEIQKAAELRVTVVGNEVFAAKISSSSQAEVDSRTYDLADTPYTGISLPSEVETKCKSLLSELQIEFGAFDLIQDEHGDLVFLEVNPTGSWAYIQYLTGLPIATAIGNWLVAHEALST